MDRIIVNDQIIRELLPDRNPQSSKRDFGYVGVLGGCDNYCGAPSLAGLALSALRVGCGVSRVIVEESISSIVSGFAPEITIYKVSSFENKEELINSFSGLKGLAVGMGWGRDKSREKALVDILTNYNGTLLIDADGLFALKMVGLDQLRNAKSKIILTPHLGEFSRLVGKQLTLDDNLEKLAVDFAREYNITLLLKGKSTIVTDGKKLYISESGTPAMATAGSGDVLSGVIIGLTGFLPPLEGAFAGAYIAGKAGERASEKYGQYGMLSSDTIKELAFAIRKIRG